MTTNKHFGVAISKAKEPRLTSESFISNANPKPSLKTTDIGWVKDNLDDEGDYKDKVVKRLTSNALRSYKHYFKKVSKNDTQDFNRELDKYLQNNTNFFEVKDLRGYTETKGYYIMVLDQYNLAYIGKSKHIAKRIREHWGSRKHLDRLVFGKWNQSKVSIDSYGALDCTRIYINAAGHCEDIIEQFYIERFPEKYIVNRLTY